MFNEKNVIDLITNYFTFVHLVILLSDWICKTAMFELFSFFWYSMMAHNNVSNFQHILICNNNRNKNKWIFIKLLVKHMFGILYFAILL